MGDGVAAGIGLAWFVDLLNLAAAVLPGQSAGYAAAGFAGAWRVKRSERRHRARVARRTRQGEQELYAVPLPARGPEQGEVAAPATVTATSAHVGEVPPGG